jgi:hypothetical protein
LDIATQLIAAFLAKGGEAAQLSEYLFDACAHGYEAVMAHILEVMGAPSDEDIRAALSLSRACGCPSAEASLSMAKRLLSRLGVVFDRSAISTALSSACGNAHVDCMKLLLGAVDDESGVVTSDHFP